MVAVETWSFSYLLPAPASFLHQSLDFAIMLLTFFFASPSSGEGQFRAFMQLVSTAQAYLELLDGRKANYARGFIWKGPSGKIHACHFTAALPLVMVVCCEGRPPHSPLSIS